MIRVALPAHLRNLAQVRGEVTLSPAEPISQATILDALEAQFPQLRGTVRDHTSKERRAFIRFFVCGEDWSHLSADTPLPAEIIEGKEPFRIVGAMAGG